ncbi:SDR family NAD(P)-dependent oxidoreductase [Streptosporangium lutulentum]
MAVWFVTGAARGIGHRVAREALRRGHRVVATGRDLAAVTDAFDGVAGEVLPVELDLLRPEAPASAVEQAMRRFGRIDVLVHAASRTVRDPLQETTDAQARALFDVNVVGMLAVTRAVLPVLSAQRAGRIIAVGSAAGFSTPPVRVCTARPWRPSRHCARRSAPSWTGSSLRDRRRTRPLRHLADGVRSRPAPAGDPYKAASAILDLLTVDDPPLRLQLGADAVAHVEAKLERVSQELDLWRPVSLGTVFDLDLPRQNGHRPPRDT